MSHVVLLSKAVAGQIRTASKEMQAEDGGALFGEPTSGDVIAHVRAPRHTHRSRIIVCMKGPDLDKEAEPLLAANPNLKWLGFWHLHFGLSELSTGDMLELARLHDSGVCPPCGIVKILAIKNERESIKLRAWLSFAKDALEEVELFEVDDPTTARTYLPTGGGAPPMRLHSLSLRAGASRLKAELEDLAKEGVLVHSHRVTPFGVELTFTHTDHEGELRCTLGAEGWERPPKIEIVRHGRAQLVLSPLGTLLASWCSAFRLPDLVSYARTRGVWPHNVSTKGKEKVA